MREATRAADYGAMLDRFFLYRCLLCGAHHRHEDELLHGEDCPRDPAALHLLTVVAVNAEPVGEAWDGSPAAYELDVDPATGTFASVETRRRTFNG